jgi:hypothetical protein
MGYTHYWYRPAGHEDRDAFRRLGTDAKKIIEVADSLGIEVRGWDSTGRPDFSELHFSLNGGCETFSWPSSAGEGNSLSGGKSFDFCKTQLLPYDAVVTAILIRAKHVYGDALEVSSDGSWEDWAEGARLYEATFGEPAQNPFGELAEL